ncbi:hypothetical protein GCM10023100_70050 [Actinocorallia cavernae]|uniref:Uncharacterized protein n=2 Tax=Actinomycetes TaxID=1760 RepID=A0ABP8T888_9ACTN
MIVCTPAVMWLTPCESKGQGYEARRAPLRCSHARPGRPATASRILTGFAPPGPGRPRLPCVAAAPEEEWVNGSAYGPHHGRGAVDPAVLWCPAVITHRGSAEQET